MELRELVRGLYGIDQPQGCTEEEIGAVREIFGALPAVVEEFWRTFGRMPQLNYVQDNWIFPADFQKWKHLAEDDDLLAALPICFCSMRIRASTWRISGGRI